MTVTPMFYMCENCGEVMEPDELKLIPNGGGDIGEDWYVCPYCGHDSLAEVEQCDDCGHWVDPSELYCGKCRDCIDREAEDVEQTKQYGDERKAEVEINAVYYKAFSLSEIDELLAKAFDELPTDKQKKYCLDLVDDDPYDFAEWLQED